MATTQREEAKRGAAKNGVAPERAETTELVVPPERLLQYYRDMVNVRQFEQAAERSFRQGKIGGYLHLYLGQEAVARGFLDAHREGDKVITAYRDHAHALFLGCHPNNVMAELFGKATGIVKGKGGSMHLFDTQHDLWGGYGIVGGHIPLGVGIAYALLYQQTDQIVQLYFGDGAINSGAFHEAANLAGLWGRDGLCPCLFILENNQYGMGTSVERSTAMTDLGAKFSSYGIEHERVDGMNLEAVIEVAHRASDFVRETGRPYAVEALTYRIAPHGAADFLERYRTKEEVAEQRKRDPIHLLELRLLELGIASEEELSEIQNEAKQLAAEAVKPADESPVPPLEELYTDVYA
jgi:pyruvate dehydrogenase E1 component alpha subunit